MTRSFRLNAAGAHALLALCLLVLAAGCSSKSEVPAEYTKCVSPQVVCLPETGAAFCADLATDLTNCGTCGHACDTPLNGGAVACTAGKCVPSCTPGGTGSDNRLCEAIPGTSTTTTDPDGGTVTTGGGGASLKCTDVAIDIFNCGACGTICKSNEVCTAGACVAATTDPTLGTTLCGAEADGGGIYKNLLVDPANCGACGKVIDPGSICQAGSAIPCPIAVCNNTCVDTQADPKNCGGCGVVAKSCDQGKPRDKLEIVVGMPASTTFVPNTAGATFRQFIQIKSAIRVALVQASITVGANTKAGPFNMTFNSATGEQAITEWYADLPVNAATAEGTAVKISIAAVDELYRIGRADELDHLATLDINVLTKVPVAGFNAPPTVKLNNTLLATPATAGGNTPWVPLNAGKLHLEAGLSAGTSALIKSIEFRANGVANSKARADVIDGQNSALDVLANDFGVGNSIAITACAIDLWGNVVGACSAPTFLSVGLLRTPSGGSPPVITKGTDGSHVIFSTGPITTGGAGLFVQAFDQPFLQTAANPALLGAQVGADVFVANSIYPTYETTGVLAVKKDGTAVERIDTCPGSTPACAPKASYVTPTGTNKWVLIEQQGISKAALGLLAALVGTETTGRLWLAKGAPDSTDPAPQDSGGAVIQFGNSRIQQADSGALAAFVQPPGTGATPQVVLFHPTGITSNNGLKVYPTLANGVAKSLTLFPGGEMIWEYTNQNGDHFMQAAWFDGTNQPVQLGAAVAYGVATGTGSTNLAQSFFVPSPGILVGRVPATNDATEYEVIEINLKQTTPGFTRPAPFSKLTVGPVNTTGTSSSPLRGVTTRNSGPQLFTTSDDRASVLFATREVVDLPVRDVYSIWLLDLATSAARQVYKSENILDGALPFKPHFVRAASSWIPELPLTGNVNAIVWGEYLPVNLSGGVTSTLFFRPFVATWTGTAAPTVKEFSPNALASLFFSGVGATFAESAAGQTILWAVETGEGRLDLYQGTFAGTGAQLVMQGIVGFQVREDKARILVQRNDGTLFAGNLSNGVSGLAPILDGLLSVLPANNSMLAGFTPDGNHAFALINSTLNPGNGFFDGILTTVNLATGARTNWGGAIMSTSSGDTLFLDDAKVMMGNDTLNRFTAVNKFFVASSDAPTVHPDTKLLAPAAVTSSAAFSRLVSVDGAEGRISFSGGSGWLRKDKTITSSSAFSALMVQPATFSPFGGPFLPDWGTHYNGATRWKKWGGATADLEHTLAVGKVMTMNSAVFTSGYSADRTEFFFNGLDGNATADLYLMVIDGPGKVAPKPPVQ